MPENTKIGYVILEGNDLDSRARIVSDKGRRIEAEGIVQTAEEENRNGRSYLRGDLYREYCQSPRTKELLELGYMRGETGHPLDNSIIRQQTIQPERCCVKYLKFWMEGNDVWARFKGTNNEYGDAFDADLRDGDRPAFSLRALGTIKNTGRGAEVKGIKLITYDRVIYPSHDKAYTHKLVSESSVVSEGNNICLSNDDPGRLIPITNQSVLDYIKTESCTFKQIKESFDLLYDDIKLVNGKSQVQLTDRAGGIFVINLENYIHNEIMEAVTGVPYKEMN